MTLTSRLPAVTRPAAPPTARYRRPTALLLGLQGIALLPLVADGSATWIAARITVTLAVTALGVKLVLGPRRPPAVAATTLFGIAGMGAGIGIGLAHLNWAGITAQSATGLVCLVIGGSLLIVAAVRTVQGLHGWWRLLTVPAAFAVLVLGVYPVSMAVMVTNSPTVAEDGRTPADLGVAYQDVVMTTEDGVELAAWWLATGDGTAVVLLHGGGAGSNRTSVLEEAAVLNRNGFGVLVVAARGHGASTGTPMEWGWHGDVDVAAAVDWLSSRDDVRPDGIGVVGLSMGGEEAITAAAGDDRIGAVVAEGATNRVLADDDAVLPDHPGRWINVAADVVKFTLADLLTSASPPRSLRAAVEATAPRRILFVTAGAVPTEARAASFFDAVAPSSVEVWEVEGAAHTAGLATAPEEWERTVVGFLRRALEA